MARFFFKLTSGSTISLYILIAVTGSSSFSSGESSTETCTSALLVYESLSVLPDEIKYIWKKKFTLTTFLYLSIRYGTLSLVIWFLIWFFVCSLFFYLAAQMIMNITTRKSRQLPGLYPHITFLLLLTVNGFQACRRTPRLVLQNRHFYIHLPQYRYRRCVFSISSIYGPYVRRTH